MPTPASYDVRPIRLRRAGDAHLLDDLKTAVEGVKLAIAANDEVVELDAYVRLDAAWSAIQRARRPRNSDEIEREYFTPRDTYEDPSRDRDTGLPYSGPL